MSARDRDRRSEHLQREIAALRNLLDTTRAEVAELRAGTIATAEPVGLAEAARIAGISAATMYQHARRYGGWKVDPTLPKSQWRFDPERGPPGGRRRSSHTASAAPQTIDD